MKISNYAKIISLAFFLVFLPAASCTTNQGKITPNPPVITDQHACPAACANLEKLGCPEAQPIDMGTNCFHDADCFNVHGSRDMTQTCINGRCNTSCTNFCVETENQGVWLDPICVSKITSCSQIETCPLPKVPEPTCEGPACPPDIRTK